MIQKDMIGYAILIILMIIGITFFASKGDVKVLQQKIMQTEQTISTVSDMARTFAGVSIYKDYTGINMATMKSKGLFQYDVDGTGTSSTIAMPFDDTILMSISPTSNNKGFIITVSLSAHSDLDATGKQTFEDKIYADFKSTASNITGYTASGGDGTLSLQFAH